MRLEFEAGVTQSVSAQGFEAGWETLRSGGLGERDKCVCLQLAGFTSSVTLGYCTAACFALWLCHRLLRGDFFFYFQRPLGT